MKNFSNFSNNALSKNEMKNVKGGVLKNCECTSGNNSGAKFLYSDAHRTDAEENAYRHNVCNGGTSSCVGTVVMVPEP
jgi:natural product precursor